MVAKYAKRSDVVHKKFGLMDYNARYYSLLGRFPSPDTIVPEPGNLLVGGDMHMCIIHLFLCRMYRHDGWDAKWNSEFLGISPSKWGNYV